MLTENQIKEIREHLEKAQNPVFYYDNDADGLCSFLLLRRFLGRGKGVAIRSFPELDKHYARKVQELKGDYVFILDKPVLSEEFVKEIDKMNLPCVWIDHHDMPSQDYSKYSNFYTYNVSRNKEKSAEPVSYLCYEIIGKKKEEMWISLMGCIADHYLPEFAKKFEKDYPEMWGKNIEKPFEAYFGTEIGKMADALNFGLKDSTTHIVQMQNYLLECKSPNDVLAEHSGNINLRKRYKDMRKKYSALIEKAKEAKHGEMIMFEYGGDLSISSNLSNELSYLYPKKIIMVAFKKGTVANISLRGKKIREVLDKVLKQMQHASGGGHEDAVGARIRLEDLEKFKELLEKELKERK